MLRDKRRGVVRAEEGSKWKRDEMIERGKHMDWEMRRRMLVKKRRKEVSGGKEEYKKGTDEKRDEEMA